MMPFSATRRKMGRADWALQQAFGLVGVTLLLFSWNAPQVHGKQRAGFKLDSKSGPLYNERCDACAAVSIQAFTVFQLAETRNKAIRGKPDVQVRQAHVTVSQVIRILRTKRCTLIFWDSSAGGGRRLERNMSRAILEAVVRVQGSEGSRPDIGYVRALPTFPGNVFADGIGEKSIRCIASFLQTWCFFFHDVQVPG